MYFAQVLPLITRLRPDSADARLLMKYYWDTIDECVPAPMILTALHQTGFVEVHHRVVAGCLSEYVAVRPRVAT